MGSPKTSDQGNVSPCNNMIDNLKRDRFEMLSAYLDGEVTAAERRQVEQWLESDPTVQCLYKRLLKLRQGMRMMPIPAAERSAEQTTERVFCKIDRRQRLAIAWGGVAIAAVFIGFFSNLVPSFQGQNPQLALEKSKQNVSSDARMIALDQPIMEIPKTAVSAPLDPLQTTTIHNP